MFKIGPEGSETTQVMVIKTFTNNFVLTGDFAGFDIMPSEFETLMSARKTLKSLVDSGEFTTKTVTSNIDLMVDSPSDVYVVNVSSSQASDIRAACIILRNKLLDRVLQQRNSMSHMAWGNKLDLNVRQICLAVGGMEFRLLKGEYTFTVLTTPDGQDHPVIVNRKLGPAGLEHLHRLHREIFDDASRILPYRHLLVKLPPQTTLLTIGSIILAHKQSVNMFDIYPGPEIIGILEYVARMMQQTAATSEHVIDPDAWRES